MKLNSFCYYIPYVISVFDLYARVETELYLIWFSHSESQKTFNITGDVCLILNSKFHGVFAFFDSDGESRSANTESSTVMLEFFSCKDFNINIINNDEIVRAIVIVKFRNTVALMKLLILFKLLNLLICATGLFLYSINYAA